MRSYKISLIQPSTSEPSAIVLDASVGDVSSYFHGKVWVNADYSSISPYWMYTSDTAPADYKLIVATTFDVTGNSKYNGTYTTYTTLTASDYQNVVFDGTNTKIRVFETLDITGTGTELTDGYLTNFSTYVFSVKGGSPIVIYEGQTYEEITVSLLGKYKSGWAEQLMQSMIDLSQHDFGNVFPANPLPGQIFINSADMSLKVFDGSAWRVPNTATMGQRVIIHQSAAQSTWTISHGLGLAAPFIAETQFFVDTPNGVKMIIPQDITYVDANTISVTFSNAETGYAIVRS